MLGCSFRLFFAVNQEFPFWLPTGRMTDSRTRAFEAREMTSKSCARKRICSILLISARQLPERKRMLWALG